jgi:hypothetical protein
MELIGFTEYVISLLTCFSVVLKMMGADLSLRMSKDFTMKRWNYLMSGNDEARVTCTSQYCDWIGVGVAGSARRHQDNALAN